MITFFQDIETQHGIVTKYHKLTFVGLDHSRAKVIEILIDSWVSKEAHDLEKASFERIPLFLPYQPPEDLLCSDLMEWAYSLMTDPSNKDYFNVSKFIGAIRE